MMSPGSCGLDQPMISQAGSIGLATYCDAAHLRQCVQKGLGCLKVVCDVLRWKVKYAQYFGPDF